jgi:hypothetical protein
MKKGSRITRIGTKRFLGGILFIIVGYLLLKRLSEILSLIAWVLIIIGTIFILIGLGKLERAEKIVERIEEKIVPKSKQTKNIRKKR